MYPHRRFSDKVRKKSKHFSYAFIFGETLLKPEFSFIIIQPLVIKINSK